jgi:hypothetical protein
VFCTTALFTWKLEATDVSRMAGHSSYRITLDMYTGTTAGVLDRARTATQLIIGIAHPLDVTSLYCVLHYFT